MTLVVLSPDIAVQLSWVGAFFGLACLGTPRPEANIEMGPGHVALTTTRSKIFTVLFGLIGLIVGAVLGGALRVVPGLPSLVPQSVSLKTQMCCLCCCLL